MELARTAVKYSDGVILASADIDEKIAGYCRDAKIPLLPFNAESFADGSYIDEYNAFYDEL